MIVVCDGDNRRAMSALNRSGDRMSSTRTQPYRPGEYAQVPGRNMIARVVGCWSAGRIWRVHTHDLLTGLRHEFWTNDFGVPVNRRRETESHDPAHLLGPRDCGV